MFVFGHIGLTIAAAGLPRAAAGNRPGAQWWRQIDYRLVALGSLLPDLLDKSVWLLGNGNIFPSGRAFGHTLLFNLVLILAAALLARSGRRGLLAFSLASLMHIVLDGIWTRPTTLWWPLLGSMLHTEPANLSWYVLHGLLTDPLTYIPELTGFAIVVVMGLRLLRRKGVGRFMRSGALE